MIGAIIRKLRTDKGLTMKELGQILGVAESTISLYENDKREPNYEMLKKISELFQVSTAYLLDEGIYSKKEYIKEHIDIILEQIKIDLGSKIADFLGELDYELQFKVLTGILLDINVDLENRTLQLIYYI